MGIFKRLGEILGRGISDTLSTHVRYSRKFSAEYLGRTELYNKVTNCPPVMLVHGLIYQISVSNKPDYHGWIIVRVYDADGKYLTWIPYSAPWTHYWAPVDREPEFLIIDLPFESSLAPIG